MRISKNKLFPHPVLWHINDDYIDSDISIDIAERVEFGRVVIEYNAYINNDDILKYMELGKLSLGINIECPLTMYRKTHITSQLSGEIKIDEDNINHVVEITTLVLATEEILGYKNDSLNEDYDDISIDVKKGSILAISDNHTIDINKDNMNLGERESLMSIVKSIKDEPMSIEVLEDQITIMLNESDFNNFQQIQSGSKSKSIIHSLFVLPALIYTLEYISKEEEYGDFSLDQYKWYKSFKKLFETQEMALSSETIQKHTSFKLANMILNNPVGGAMDTFISAREEDE